MHIHLKGFPGGVSGDESTCQCRRLRRHRFDPWVGKIPWSSKWQPAPIILPGKFHGQESLVGYSPWGCKESDMTEHTNTLGAKNTCDQQWSVWFFCFFFFLLYFYLFESPTKISHIYQVNFTGKRT